MYKNYVKTQTNKNIIHFANPLEISKDKIYLRKYDDESITQEK